MNTWRTIRSQRSPANPKGLGRCVVGERTEPDLDAGSCSVKSDAYVDLADVEGLAHFVSAHPLDVAHDEDGAVLVWKGVDGTFEDAPKLQRLSQRFRGFAGGLRFFLRRIIHPIRLPSG